MADFLKTLTKRNTTKPGQPVQPELVISGPQTFRTVRCVPDDLCPDSARESTLASTTRKASRYLAISSPPSSSDLCRVSPKASALARRADTFSTSSPALTRYTHALYDPGAHISQEDVPESLRLGAPSSGAHKPPAAPTTRPSTKKKGSGFEISGPTTFQHKLHVDEEYNWTGTDPTGAFRLLDKLGEGYAFVISAQTLTPPLSAYGSVYKAEAKDAKMVLAIKMVLIRNRRI